MLYARKFGFTAKSLLHNIHKVQFLENKEVSLKKIIVEGYGAVGSLNTKKKAFSFRTICCYWCSLLISVNGKAFKSAIKRPIKIRTHRVVREHLTATDTDKNIINK